MKHLKTFEASESRIDINHIFDIARDEGLPVITSEDSHKYKFNPNQYYIDRYPMSKDGSSMDDPIISNERFFGLVIL